KIVRDPKNSLQNHQKSLDSLKVHPNSSKIRSTSIKFAPQTEKFAPFLIFSPHTRAISLDNKIFRAIHSQFHSTTNFPVPYIKKSHANYIKSRVTLIYYNQNYTNYQLVIEN